MESNLFYITLPVYIAVFMAEIDVSIVNIALPTITRELNASTAEISRIVMLYLITMISLIILFGKISDIVGKKFIFLSGYAIFTITSLLCGLSPEILSLQIFRALQGIGGAMLFATTNAIIIQNVPENMMGKAFSFIGVASSIALIGGAPLGGLLISHLHWRWIFFINLLPGLAGFILAYKMLPHEKPEKISLSDIDFTGTFLSIIMIISFVFTLNMGQEKGWFSLNIIIIFLIFIFSLAFFILRERSFKNPIIDFKIFKNHDLSCGLLSGIFIGMIMSGFVFIFPFFFERIMAFNTQKTGLIMSIFPVFSLIVTPIGGILADKINSRKGSIVSAVCFIIPLILFKIFKVSTELYLIIIPLLLLGGFSALFLSFNTKLVMKKTDKNFEGITSAISSICIFFGAMLGVAVFDTVVSSNFPVGYNYMTTPPEFLMKGFYNAIISGIILCILAVGTLFLSNKSEKS